MTQADVQKIKIQNGELTSFFDCLYDILMKCSGGELIHAELFKKYFSSYMVCRYISMKPDLIQYAEYLNIMQTKLTQEQFFILAYNLIPKQRSGFIKYLKKQNKKQEKNLEENININNMNLLLFDI